MALTWRRPLSRPIGRFRTIGDVRDFILAEYPDGPPANWHTIGALAIAAAGGGELEELEGCLAIMVAHGGRAAARD